MCRNLSTRTLVGLAKVGVGLPVPAQELPGLWPWHLSLGGPEGPGWPYGVNLVLTSETNYKFELLHFPRECSDCGLSLYSSATLVLTEPGWDVREESGLQPAWHRAL